MTVQLTLTGPVPKWATKRKRRASSTIRAPSGSAAGRRAVAPRYGDRVNLWSIWNEPNHPEFLGPQYKRRQAAHAAALPQALRGGRERDPRRPGRLDATRCCSARPRRSATRTSSRRSAFLRGALCLNARLQASARAARSCGSTATRTTPTRAGPARRSSSDDADEVSIGTLGRLIAALDKAARAGAHRAQPRDLPDRVRDPEQARPDRGRLVRAPGRVPRDLRADRVREPARQGVLAVPDERRPAAQGHAGWSATPASRPACGRRRARRSPPYNGFMLPLAAQRYGSQRRAVGPRAPGGRPDGGHDRAQDRQGRLEAADRAADRRASTGSRPRTTPSTATARSGRARTASTVTGPPIRAY